MLHRQFTSLLGGQIIFPVRVISEHNHISGIVIAFDFSRNAQIQILRTGKAQRPVHKIFLVIYHD